MEQRDLIAVAVFENFHFGLVLLDNGGSVVLLNRAARAIVAAGDGIAIRDRRLIGQFPDADAQLQQLMSAAVRTPPAAGGVLAVSRPSARRAYVVTASPLPDGAAPDGAAAVAVFISDPERPRELPEGALIRLYRLTRAEAGIAVRIVAGMTLEQAAEDLDIAVTTARLHLQRVLKKTGTHRQSELVRLLLTAIPPGL